MTPLTNSIEEEIMTQLNKIYKVGIRHGVKKYEYLGQENATIVKATQSIITKVKESLPEKKELPDNPNNFPHLYEQAVIANAYNQAIKDMEERLSL